MQAQLRIARPVTDLLLSAAMYKAGLELQELGGFVDHDGFDGVMLGVPGQHFHLEFTVCRAHPIKPNPTAEDLLVFYLPDHPEWMLQCTRMASAGFLEVQPFNPYWASNGRTYQDRDGYRVVLQHGAWGPR